MTSICWYAGIGSRETPADVLEEMTAIAQWLNGLGFWLRSGGAVGADTAFARGAGRNKRIYNASDCTEEARGIASRYHPAWGRCSGHAKNLLGRNTFQIVGESLNQPSKFVVCWTKNGKDAGGTGNAIRHALDIGIQVFNLKNDNDAYRLAEFAPTILKETEQCH